MFKKAQKPAVEPSSEELINCGMVAAQAIIDRIVDAEKASQSGAGIPRESIRQMVMKGSTCWCRIANHLLEKERNELARQR
jgi:hypothetical protein